MCLFLLFFSATQLLTHLESRYDVEEKDKQHLLWLLRKARNVHKGLAYKPMSLENTAGKQALESLLTLCKFVVEDELLKKGIGDDKLNICALGTGKNWQGNVNLKVYSMNKCTDANALSYLSEEKVLPAHYDVPKQPKPETPDVQCSVEFGCIERFVIHGGVKSSSDMVRLGKKGSEQQNLFDQVWRQSLVGLRNSDTSYGVLLHSRGASLLKLEVKDSGEREELWTYVHKYEFIPGAVDRAPINCSQFQELMKGIISIFLELCLV